LGPADEERSVGRTAAGAGPLSRPHGAPLAEPLDVDAVSELSFPASDPPSSGPGLGSRATPADDVPPSGGRTRA
jgi:hypothetical protein